MQERHWDWHAKFAERFASSQTGNEPGNILPLPEQKLKPVSLSNNMNYFGSDLWTGWTEQKIPARDGCFCMVCDANNRLNLILRGRENKFWQSTSRKDGLWNDWYTPNNLSTAQCGNVTGNFIAERFGGDGRIVLFVQGIDGHLWDFWASPESLRTRPWNFNRLKMCALTEFNAIERLYGGLEVFAIGADGGVWHSWTMDQDHDQWSQWESLGGKASHGLYLANNLEGYPELLACDPTNALWTIRHYRDGWHEWTCLGNAMRDGCVNVSTSDGGMCVYGVGPDRALYRVARVGLNGKWGEWERLGGQFMKLIGARLLPKGELKLCLIGVDRRLWRLNASGSFDDLGGSLSYACLGVDSDGSALVTGSGFDTYLYCREV